MAAVGDPAARPAGRLASRPAAGSGAARRAATGAAGRAATIGARDGHAGSNALMPAVRALLRRRSDGEGVSRRVRWILRGTP